MAKKKYDEEDFNSNSGEDLLEATESFDQIVEAKDEVKYAIDSVDTYIDLTLDHTVSVSNDFAPHQMVTYRLPSGKLAVGRFEQVARQGFKAISIYK